MAARPQAAWTICLREAFRGFAPFSFVREEGGDRAMKAFETQRTVKLCSGHARKPHCEEVAVGPEGPT